MKKLFFVSLLILVSGCFYHREPDVGYVLANYGHSLNCEGFPDDIQKLLMDIKKKTNKVIGLLEDPKENSEKIKDLTAEIHEKSVLVEKIIQPEFTEVRFKQHLFWKIKPSECILNESYNCEITNYRVRNVYFLGVQRDDLIKNVTMINNKEFLLIKWEKDVSTLEACAEERALFVHVEVEFKNTEQISSSNHILVGRD